ncbi:unnamed protein product [Pedinophyceae sp. YPF-701]|nr:unnamed protein product [Pedinophyceae sp. YPF-701]
MAMFLQRWLSLVAALRMLSVFIGILNVDKFKTQLFDLKPEQVTPLYGRTFAAWTAVTCVLCVLCARNPTEPSIYHATMASFGVALLHFAAEYFVYETMSLRTVASPGIIASVSFLWMFMGRTYYLEDVKTD